VLLVLNVGSRCRAGVVTLVGLPSIQLKHAGSLVNSGDGDIGGGDDDDCFSIDLDPDPSYSYHKAAPTLQQAVELLNGGTPDSVVEGCELVEVNILSTAWRDQFLALGVLLMNSCPE
jgi:hypothetical protein